MDLFIQAVIAGITIGLIYALVGVGYNIVFAGTRVFNLAQGQMLMLGILLTWELRTVLRCCQSSRLPALRSRAAAVNVLVESGSLSTRFDAGAQPASSTASGPSSPPPFALRSLSSVSRRRSGRNTAAVSSLLRQLGAASWRRLDLC